MRVELMAAAAMAWVATGVLARYAHRFGMIDHPGGHKHHRDPVPMVGGLAIALAMSLMVALSSRALSGAHLVLLLAALAMLAIGVADDRYRLAPRTRLLAQAAVAALLALSGGALLADLGALLDGTRSLRLGWFAWPMTVFSVVGVMNACNMSDGMDGIAGGMVALALAGALLLGAGVTPVSELTVVAVLLGALLGFLAWNLPVLRSARAYLGDGGSLLLGTLLAWVLVSFSQGELRAFAPVNALWLYAVPLIDTVSVMWRRIADGRSPFQPDQRHLHHMLLRRGATTRGACAVVLTASLGGVLVAILATRLAWPEPAMAAGFLALALVHHLSMRRADRGGRWLGGVIADDIASARDGAPGSDR